MLVAGLSSRSLDPEGLYDAIERRLCDLGHLVAKQFPMTRREVIRCGKVCGLYFCVHGPRSVKLTAICDFEKEIVIYYGSDGLRRESHTLALDDSLKNAA